MQDIKIVQATVADVDTASSILMDASRLQAELGAAGWPEAMLTPDKLAPRAEGGELYLAYRDDSPVGVFLLQWDDQFFWPDAPTGESAFVHRLGVRRSAAGQGVGAAMILSAAERAKQAGMRYLRLDCDGRRQRLCAFYERLGFVRQADLNRGDRISARYQIELR